MSDTQNVQPAADRVTPASTASVTPATTCPPDQEHKTQDRNTTWAGGSKEPEKPENAKEDEFHKLVLQLGDLSSGLEDKALATRINQLVNVLNMPERSERPDYRTAVAYVVQDAEKQDIGLRMSGSLRAEMWQLASTFPGLQNARMQELVAGTPEIEDKATIRAIRTTAAEIARQPDQHDAGATSRIDALANRIRLATGPAEAADIQPRAEVSSSRAAVPDGITATGTRQPEQVAAAAPAPGGGNGPVGRTMLDVMSALRRPEPENSTAWDKQLTPMGDRITAYNARMQANGEEADMKRAERTGGVALAAMKEFADGPGAVLMTRVRDAAKADPEGMTGVLAEMRDGGRYAGLRQDLTVSLQHEKFAAAYDKALTSVTDFGVQRAEIDRFSGQRSDAAAITGRFQKLDADIGKAARELPSRTEGKSFTDELAERTREIVSKAAEVVVSAFSRLRGASNSASPSPS